MVLNGFDAESGSSWPTAGERPNYSWKEWLLASRGQIEGFVQDLTEACHAKISEYQDQGQQHLLIRGAWRQSVDL